MRIGVQLLDGFAESIDGVHVPELWTRREVQRWSDSWRCRQPPDFTVTVRRRAVAELTHSADFSTAGSDAVNLARIVRALS
jgi:hypothetical protein